MKIATTIEEQISILEGRGMIIMNKDKAKEILLDIGFYRLGFYTFPFEESFPNLRNRNHKLIDGTTLEDVVDLYYFDFDLRKILTNYLNRIEVNIRTFITYHCSIKHKNNNIWFVDKSVIAQSYISKFDRNVYNTVQKNPVIMRHHRIRPNDRYAPAWKTLEFMTLGNMITLCESIKDTKTKREIANYYNCSLEQFFNYINTIRIIRNSCAHGACIYNTILSQRIIHKGPANVSMPDCNNIKGIINVIKYFIERISPNRAQDMTDEIKQLISSFKERNNNCVLTSCMEIL